MRILSRLAHTLFTRENLYALLICLILIGLLILTADQSPQWIYQGF
jgi:cytochrome b561